MSSDSEQAEPPVAECDACAADLAAGEWWVFEVYSETRDLLLDQQVLVRRGVTFDFPVRRYGREIEGAWLEIEEGEVVDYGAEKNGKNTRQHYRN